jgi:hypothetical protein
MRLNGSARPALVFLALCLPSAGLAQDASAPDVPERTITYAAETHVDFHELDVTADIQRPDGTIVQVRRQADFAPMIRLRVHFNEELAASVDMIK